MIIYLAMFAVLGFCVFILWEIYRLDKLNKFVTKEISSSLYEIGIIVRAIMESFPKEKADEINENYNKIRDEIETNFKYNLDDSYKE